MNYKYRLVRINMNDMLLYNISIPKSIYYYLIYIYQISKILIIAVEVIMQKIVQTVFNYSFL